MPHMGRSFVQKVAEEQAKLEARVRGTSSTSRLDHASLEDTVLEIFDRHGVERGSFGKQRDGSFGGLVRNSPAQPTPEAPELTPADLPGAVEVTWGGGTTDFDKPMVHGHTEVLSAHSEDETEPTDDAFRLASTIRDRDGGSTTITCPTPGHWFVKLRLVGQDRVTRGEASEASHIQIKGLADSEAIGDVLDEAQERVDQARQQLEEAMADLDDKLAGLVNDKLTHSEEPPPAAHDGAHGDIWRTIDADGTVLAEHEWVVDGDTGVWEARQVSSEVIHNLDVGKLTAGSGQLAEAVIDLLWTRVVRAQLLEAEEAIIGGALIREGQIDVEHLHITEGMVGRFAEILHLVADRIEMNSFIALSGMVGHLEAAGITLSDDAGGRRFSVSGQGFRLEDTGSGQTLAQLGLHGDDLLSLHDSETGEPTVSMTGTGGVSAVHVSSVSDPHFGGLPMAGWHYGTPRWHMSESVMDYLPQGACLYHRRVFSGETTTTSGSQVGITVAHLEARIRPGRLYKIKCHDFEMGDRTAYWAQAFVTTSDDPDVRPTRPTSYTPSDSLWGPRVPGRVPPSGSGNSTALSYEWLVSFPQAQRMRVGFVVGNSSSVGNVFGSSLRHQALLSIEDLGPTTGPKGYDQLSGSRATDEVVPELPEDISQAYGITRTATYTLDLSTRTATREYYDGTPRFGRWDNGVYYMTLIEFDSWASQPGERVRTQFDVSVSSWLNAGRGHIFQSSVPTFTGLPATFHIDNDLMHMDDQRNVGRWTPRTVTPEEEALEAALSKSQPNLAVGRTGWSSISEGLPASGRINLGGGSTVARLSTELGGGSE